jgi:hypothetical protein
MKLCRVPELFETVLGSWASIGHQLSFKELQAKHLAAGVQSFLTKSRAYAFWSAGVVEKS